MAEHGESWKQVVSDVIDGKASRLKKVGIEICSHPEPAFKEKHAHSVLTAFLEEEGYIVEPNFVVDTGFRATFESNIAAEADGGGDVAGAHHLNVCILCEYDASAGGGHAAGHNLTSQASVAVAIALKKCLEMKLFSGKVTILGTPGEDSGRGAKIDMIEAGVFTPVDIALMLWPLNNNIVFPRHFTLLTVDVVYKGKAAHASAFPWEGKNALDAAVACYNNVALLRQQLKPTWMINGIIKEGGLTANTIPALTKMQFWLRAPEHTDLFFLQQKCTACFVAAAKATGCEVKYYFNEKVYHTMQHSQLLGDIYEEYAKGLDMVFHDFKEEAFHTGSTDMGNVSQVVPSLTPAFDIGTRAFKNSTAFLEAAGTEQAHENTLRAAKALAMTAAKIMFNPALIESVKHEYTLIKSPSGTLIAHHGHLS